VILRVYEDYSYEQIADTLGCSLSTARGNYHHGILALRKMMEGI
jgi:DNA-directed RNA polymerase specialized sigma24 family protein